MTTKAQLKKFFDSMDPKTCLKWFSEAEMRVCNRYYGNVGLKARARRCELRWTQAYVAALANISQPDVSLFERGKTERYAAAICLVLGLNRHKIDDRRRSNENDLIDVAP